VTAPASGASTYALLTDGSTVEIRHAGPPDVDAVREMHTAMSPDSMYLRFFSASSHMAEREARRVCREPGPGHGALLAWLGGRLVGVASYEATDRPGVAEIAFAVPDDMHHRGVATLLLEHLVSLARRGELQALTAETLAENEAMLRVFAEAGLPVQRRSADGVVQLTFRLPGSAGEDLESYLESVARRESRADVASLRHLLRPTSVAVVGASRKPDTVGRAILHNIVSCGFQGSVYAVNPHATQTRTMEGARCVTSVSDLPEAVDLAVIAVPPTAVPQVAAECGRHGDHLGPEQRGCRPAGHLPTVRDAARRAEQLRRQRPGDRPERDVRGRPPDARRGRAGGAARRNRSRAAAAAIPAGHRRVLVRVGR